MVGPRGDSGRDGAPLSTQPDHRAGGRESVRGRHCGTLVTACGQACGFACGVDAADLRRHRRERGQADHQDGHQGDQRQGRFHGARPGGIGQTLVLRALAMTRVSAETTESPVTTV